MSDEKPKITVDLDEDGRTLHAKVTMTVFQKCNPDDFPVSSLTVEGGDDDAFRRELMLKLGGVTVWKPRTVPPSTSLYVQCAECGCWHHDIYSACPACAKRSAAEEQFGGEW